MIIEGLLYTHAYIHTYVRTCVMSISKATDPDHDVSDHNDYYITTQSTPTTAPMITALQSLLLYISVLSTMYVVMHINIYTLAVTCIYDLIITAIIIST